MTKIFKCLLSAIIIIILAALPISASAENIAKNSEHDLTLSLPDGYVLLDTETAEDNIELIESLGYSLSSFKNYFKATDEAAPTPLFLGVNPSTKAQISVKHWSTDFSQKIGDLSFLDDDALAKTAKELIKTKGASYKTVSANGMKLIEIRLNTKDSGGNFCSIQYITICNQSFYSLNFTFSGTVDDAKVQTAWDTLRSFEIESNIDSSVWDAGTIILLVFLGIVVVAALVVAVIVIYSIIRDVKKRRANKTESNGYIRRR